VHLFACGGRGACSQAHVKSKKYQELVKASGEPAPAPIIMMKQQQQPADGDTAPTANGEWWMQLSRRAQQRRQAFGLAAFSDITCTIITSDSICLAWY
jgi:hypothetical protein